MLKKILNKSLKIAEWIAFAMVALVFFISFSPLLPIKNAPKTYIVKTGSMIPVIQPGSVSVVFYADPKNLKSGDVIAFKSPKDAKTIILHRINSIKTESPLTFETKGDNNNAPDNWTIPEFDVVGKYLFNIPFFGHVAEFMKKPMGFVLMVVVPALIFIIFQFIGIKKAINEEVEKRVKKLSEKNASDTASQILKSLILILAVSSFAAISSITQILAYYTDQMTLSNFSVKVTDFVAPKAPDLVAPEDEALLNTQGLVMDWTDVSDYEDMNNPVYYIYQSSHYEDFHSTAYISGKLSSSKIPASGTPDGTYYWRVKACDALNNCSSWSEVWKITIDNKAPIVHITNIDEGDVFNGEIKVKGTLVDENPDTYYVTIKDSLGHLVAETGEITDHDPFVDKELLVWDASTAPAGDYLIGFEARDAAGNKDDDDSRDFVNIKVAHSFGVTITSPKAGDEFTQSMSINIVWTLDGLAPSVDTSTEIYISTDNGATYTLIASGLANVTSYEWKSPHPNEFKEKTLLAKVVVTAENGLTGEDVSDAFYTIKNKDAEGAPGGGPRN